MCRRKGSEENNQESRNDDIDKFIENFNEMKSSMTSLTKSLMKVANESMTEVNERAKDFSLNWLFDIEDRSGKTLDDFKDTIKSTFSGTESSIDRFFPRPYLLEGNSEEVQPFSTFNPWFGRHNFHELFSGSMSAGRTPFGYYMYKGPLARYYNDCLNKDGESIWDSKGYWRCLFPNSEIPNEFLNYKKENLSGQILTKEDFNEALKTAKSDASGTIDLGEKGTYFKKFDDFLNWKNIMYNNVKQERARKREKLRERKNKLISSKTSELSTKDDVAQIVSSSSLSSLNSNPESNLVELKEVISETYRDGTSSTKYITKSKPIGASEWVNVQERVENEPYFPESSDSKNAGWFWKSKDS
ncbi:uncharacterized protein PRCAT00003108001 [Priceomyces carsonii]|uniref:uncharacterized protein n=1 Tax=Priceomyces carsonii TaxID=28549 RepID=UPI002EDB655C|nr:unnamed protein product [Priceomyces carsonii]